MNLFEELNKVKIEDIIKLNNVGIEFTIEDGLITKINMIDDYC